MKTAEDDTVQNNDSRLMDFVEEEYEQACEDWRRRDDMLWKTFASTLIISGVFVSMFYSERDLSNFQISLISLFVVLIMFIILLQQHKAKFYQDASSEYMKVLLCIKVGMTYQQYIDKINEKYSEMVCRDKRLCLCGKHNGVDCSPPDRVPRIIATRKLGEEKLPSFFSVRLSNVSASKWLYALNVLVIIIALLVFVLANCFDLKSVLYGHK
ncbi:MAG: hypothetical protein FDZ69_10240 [Deltaproteobacteria bacterium]|nr:MAG: hypothetical protein FDZ69_10240 [Deltaproteobacteria bacterium]